MNIEDKIGQMLVFGWSGDSSGDGKVINYHARTLIEEYRVGGVILMTRNVGTRTDLLELLNGMQTLATSNGVQPLFASIDQEGGVVSRLLPPNYRTTQDARHWGSLNSAELVRAEFRAIGDELRHVGLNWNFAPVLDVNSNPLNPVIGKRAFSDDPDVVSFCGAAAIMGLQEDAKVMACGKHFPGHGDTELDSHFELPTVRHALLRLQSLELLPFKSAIKAGVAAIMTAHIMFPALDTQKPATLSSKILTGMLRRELEYEGLIVTDCLEMRGIAANWPFGESAVLAVEAGADMLLCCHTIDFQRQIREGLIGAVSSGRISEARIDESLGRIKSAKNKFLGKSSD